MAGRHEPTVGDVMTADAVAAPGNASFKEIVRLLEDHRVHALPVVDDDRRVTGVVCCCDLLARYGPGWRDQAADKRHAGTAAELMTVPAITTDTSTPLSEAARLATHAHVHTIPVVDHVGVLVGVVTRSDLAKVYLRPDDEIRAEVEAALEPRSADVQVSVAEGVVMLTGRATPTEAHRFRAAADRVSGVVDVADYLDTTDPSEGT